MFLWAAAAVLIAIVYLSYTGMMLVRDKKAAESQWREHLDAAETFKAEDGMNGEQYPAEVQTATFVKSIDEVDIRNSEYKVTFEVLFRWIDDQGNASDTANTFDMEDNFQIYNGTITDQVKIKDDTTDGTRSQIFRVKATVKEVFSTRRFPLSSYQMRFYIQPKEDMSKVRLHAMNQVYAGTENQLNVSGFELLRSEIADFYYKVPHSEWYQAEDGAKQDVVYSEVLTAVELNRSSWGLYFKCIIALIGVSIWGFLCLYICTNYGRGGIELIPPVLFGMFGNIMVGANLVPDALETGLLEYINIWGIYTIIVYSVAMAKVAQIRNQQKDEQYARSFGKVMLIVLTVTIVAGHVILPACAYRW